ncbi:hypothetical protein ACLMJK_006681 [Lecanora helva]
MSFDSHFRTFKVAAELYDFDDGLTRRSPPLERQIVNLRPSPSPDYLPPPERSPTPPERQSRSSNSTKKRRPKAQASQGDAVLVGFMGGLNHPDLATRAGEEPLAQSDDSDIETPMDVDDKGPTDEGASQLVQLAENALPLVASNHGDDENQPSSTKIENPRPPRPKLLTQGSGSKKHTRAFSNSQIHMHNPESNAAVRFSTSHENGSRSAHSPTSDVSSGKDNPGSAAISPILRKFTIPNSERSPAETLPAMQNSPPPSSAKSPNAQQNLPSLRDTVLEPLLESRSPNETAPHSMTRAGLSVNNGSLNSPPVNSMTPRSGQFPSPQTVINGHLNSSLSHGHPSPAYSDASPRDRDSGNMSQPTGKPSSQAYYSHGRTPQSDELTPQSAESQLSSSSFSTASSPLHHQMEADRGRPTLPPLTGLPNGPLLTGSFKCEYTGCSAAPFQTQYLLK